MKLFHLQIPEIRKLMHEELDLDIASNNQFYLSPHLTSTGQKLWHISLWHATNRGTEKTLYLCIKNRIQHPTLFANKNTSKVIARTLADDEFNRFYMRAVCRFAIQNGHQELLIYRCRQGGYFSQASYALLGRKLPPQPCLVDLRIAPHHRVNYTNLVGVASSDTGLSLRLVQQ